MNVIFEGISGAGKSTIIKQLCDKLKDENIVYERIGDLEYETPIKNVLNQMVSNNPLMNENAKFNTSLYESLLLAANHHYVQEKLRNSDKVCVYDRDFLSLLAYQKIMLENEYENFEEIFEIYKKLVLINLKKIDYIFYVDIPLDISVKRSEARDNRAYTEEDINLLKKIKAEYLLQLKEYKDVLVNLNGLDDPNENSIKVLNYIKKGMK